jgi:hypothetical protein
MPCTHAMIHSHTPLPAAPSFMLPAVPCSNSHCRSHAMKSSWTVPQQNAPAPRTMWVEVQRRTGAHAAPLHPLRGGTPPLGPAGGQAQAHGSHSQAKTDVRRPRCMKNTNCGNCAAFEGQRGGHTCDYWQSLDLELSLVQPCWCMLDSAPPQWQGADPPSTNILIHTTKMIGPTHSPSRSC